MPGDQRGPETPPGWSTDAHGHLWLPESNMTCRPETCSTCWVTLGTVGECPLPTPRGQGRTVVPSCPFKFPFPPFPMAPCCGLLPKGSPTAGCTPHQAAPVLHCPGCTP